MIIDESLARKIFDSRGNPPSEIEVCADDGCYGVAEAPAGASAGPGRAFPVIVNCPVPKSEFGVGDRRGSESTADPKDIWGLLQEICGTGNFSNFGGNLFAAWSVAVARAAAARPLPLFLIRRVVAAPGVSL